MYGVRWIEGKTPYYVDASDIITARRLVAIIGLTGVDADFFEIETHTQAANQILRYGGRKPRSWE